MPIYRFPLRGARAPDPQVWAGGLHTPWRDKEGGLLARVCQLRLRPAPPGKAPVFQTPSPEPPWGAGEAEGHPLWRAGLSSSTTTPSHKMPWLPTATRGPRWSVAPPVGPSLLWLRTSRDSPAPTRPAPRPHLGNLALTVPEPLPGQPTARPSCLTPRRISLQCQWSASAEEPGVHS